MRGSWKHEANEPSANMFLAGGTCEARGIIVKQRLPPAFAVDPVRTACPAMEGFLQSTSRPM